ncbi:MAG: family 1 glycosylhydrolase [Chloroflexota bacterium]
MPEAIFNFPRGFLWGTATAAYQVEGNSKNNQWHQWEQPGKIANEDRCGLACDWWGGRWREDFDRAVEGGHNAHRFSVEWSRIQPAPDRWDEHALDRYAEMLRGLNDRGLFPVVTLQHFTDPLWVTEMGGWEADEIAGLFAGYAAKVVEALKGYVTTWVTINEPNVMAAMGYVTGEFPPGKQDIPAMIKVVTNQARGHGLAYHRIKELQPEARVGIALNWRGFNPARNWHPLDRVSAGLHNQAYNEFFPKLFTNGSAQILGKRVIVPEAKGTQDYVGINYYSSDTVKFSLGAGLDELFTTREYPEGTPLSPNGMIASQPEEFFKALNWALKFKAPIIVTENGVEDMEDSFRREYLALHIHQLWHAVNFNYPIKGYFLWSLVDNFEWNLGWQRRFGLWELDPETQERRKRPSADLYAAISKQNALSAEMVREFAPEAYPKIFPG